MPDLLYHWGGGGFDTFPYKQIARLRMLKQWTDRVISSHNDYPSSDQKPNWALLKMVGCLLAIELKLVLLVQNQASAHTATDEHVKAFFAKIWCQRSMHEYVSCV